MRDFSKKVISDQKFAKSKPVLAIKFSCSVLNNNRMVTGHNCSPLSQMLDFQQKILAL